MPPTEFPLSNACANKNIEMAKSLLDQGHPPDEAGSTLPPLIACVIQRELPILQLLLARGADPNLPACGTKMTALHFACMQSQHEIFPIAEALLLAGADPLAESDVGTPKAIAKSNGSDSISSIIELAELKNLLTGQLSSAGSRRRI